jgi:hypothetical protein
MHAVHTHFFFEKMTVIGQFFLLCYYPGQQIGTGLPDFFLRYEIKFDYVHPTTVTRLFGIMVPNS